MLYSKNKDALPLKTISTIKQILEKNNVLFFEYFYSNLDSPIQSLTVNLFFQNSLISVNGKGTSKDYALASAYGELMERLQNGMLFRLYNNFYYDKNEKNTNFAELKKSENLFIKEANITKRKIEKVNKLTTPALYYEEKIKNIITVPFENISEKRISYLPIKYIFSIQSTTGMCSGNTKEEALIQGICEIYERYYQQKFIANDLTYKRIKESAYEKYDDLKEIIKFLKKHNIDITIFDASEGENIPVVFAYFEDKTTNTYKIVFGCATTLAIAIERTITEYLQGISFSDIQRRKTNGINRKKTRKKIDKYLNLINSYTNNNTFLTEEQLNILNEKKYATKNNLKHFKIYENKTNKENLDLILKYTLKKVGNIYIKDASIFGFPSYYIVIPKLSLYTKYKSSSGFQNYCKCSILDRICGFSQTLHLSLYNKKNPL